MTTIIAPRCHFYEIDDQTWFPPYLRAKVQVVLTYLWTFQPFIFDFSPSSALVSVLRQTLGSKISSFTFVDFCAGAGGPIPIIENLVNTDLRRDNVPEVNFVLTDLWPNPEAWKEVTKKSEGRIRWVETGVDAGRAPGREVLLGEEAGKKKVFRMFCLAFHHFEDDGAGRIVRDAILNSDGFGIFELQNRSIWGFFQVFMLGPILTFTSLFHQPFQTFSHLFLTYIIPILPFVVVFDGYVSALRTRTPEEIMAIIKKVTTEEEREGWVFESDMKVYAPPVGRLHWFIAQKKGKDGLQ